MTTVEVWRASDVAEVYGVDASTVHRWERRGRLRAARRDPGGAKYWLADEVLADLTAEPPAPPISTPAELPLRSVNDLAAATRRPRRRRASR